MIRDSNKQVKSNSVNCKLGQLDQTNETSMKSPRVLITRSPPVDTSTRRQLKAKRKSETSKKLDFGTDEQVAETKETEDSQTTEEEIKKETEQNEEKKQIFKSQIIENYFDD